MSTLLALALIFSLAIWVSAYSKLWLLLGARRELQPRSTPGISILKPLKGIDQGLAENLEAIFRQDYPNFEVLLGAEDPEDPALLIAREVASRFPERRSKVCLGGWPEGLNPKVRVLRRLLTEAEHQLVLVSDSNVRPEPGYLSHNLALYQESGACLVHSLLVSRGGGSLGAHLENLQMNGWVMPSIALCELVHIPCVVGKSMLFAQADLEKVGGFAGVQDILAEDFMLGDKLSRAGYKVSLSTWPLPVVSAARDVQSFVNRHVRWGQLRRNISPASFAVEIFANTLHLAILALACGHGTWGLGALAVKWSLELLLHYRQNPGQAPLALLYIPLKDLLVPWLWAKSAVKTTVSWRGHRFRIGRWSRLSPLP